MDAENALATDFADYADSINNVILCNLRNLRLPRALSVFIAALSVMISWNQPMKNDYFSAIFPVIERIRSTQSATIQQAGRMLAEVIAAGHLVHLFGSGHSVIPVLDIFPRYGSYPGFHPLIDPRLMWSNVLGPGGVKELLWLERREGYARIILESQPVQAGDAMVVFSHGGMNAVPVEMAAECRRRGLKVVAVTCAANRPRLAQHADLVIDNCVPPEDALVPIEGWEHKVAAGSTAAVIVISMALTAEVARELSLRGMKPPVFVSPNVAGVKPDHNLRVFEEYARTLQVENKSHTA